MKYIISLSLIISNVAFAGLEMIKPGLKILENHLRSHNSEECHLDDPKSAPWCKDLYKYVCSIRKSSEKLRDLNDLINQKTWKTISPRSDLKSKVTIAMKALMMSEDEVFLKGKVTRPEVVQVFTDAKLGLIKAITSNPDLSLSKKEEIASKIQSVKLKTGPEYIADLEAYGAIHSSMLPEVELRSAAIGMYSSICGANGLEVNAFYEDGILVLCPGLIYSLEDYNPETKVEILNGLSFTIGHELGHAIDSDEEPELYKSMGECYRQINSDPNVWSEETSAEITADYWGSIVMGERLKQQGVRGSESVKVISYAFDSLCSEMPQSTQDDSTINHPEAVFRLNHIIGSQPLIRETLNCESPSIGKPSCTISGKVPKD